MRDDILRILNSANGSFVSGEEISRRLNVTRAAVWKHMRALNDEGVELEALPRKGYRLKNEPNIVCAALVEPHLNTRELGRNAVFIASAPSSNTIARQLAAQGCASGTIVVVEDQTNGRGRRGRGWINSPGLDICVSIVLRPNIETQFAPRFTLAAALGVYGMLKWAGIEPSIKWPNDILVSGKKLSGILLELQGSMETLDFIVIGLGVNINTSAFPDEFSQSVTSMKKEAGNGFERSRVLAELLNAMEPYFDACADKAEFPAMLEQYKAACVTIGKNVILTGINGVLEGVAEDVDQNGHLILRDKAGNMHAAAAGDVTLSTK